MLKKTAILNTISRKKYDLNLVTFDARNAQCHEKSEEKKRKNHNSRDSLKNIRVQQRKSNGTKEPNYEGQERLIMPSSTSLVCSFLSHHVTRLE